MHFPNSLLPFIFSYFLLHSQAFHSHLNSTTDQNALLSFKSSVSSDPHRVLDSWHPNTSFCLWPGVLCNKIKHRVNGLSLANLSLVGTFSPQITNLSFLQILHLPNNSFSGQIPSQIHRLPRLKVLNLHSNNLHGSIPPSLSSCSMLRVIDLSHNKLQGTIPSELGRLSKLQDLNFEANKLSGSIPSAFGNLSSLYSLVLGGNQIKGQIPAELGRLSRLRYLHLGNNKISGSFPMTLLNLTSLRTLEFPINKVSGELPSDLFSALSNLRKAYMGLNMLQGRIPESLSNASNLQRLDLSNNQFSGEVPLLWNLEKIETINLEMNVLTSDGEKGLGFVTSLSNSTLLQELTISTNLFSGQLPSSIGNLSTQLYWLSLSENQLNGNLPQEIGSLAGLTLLSMDTNSFTGEIPSSLGNLQDLQALYLYTNLLSGPIPESLGNLSVLSEIGLDHNRLSGGIPLSFSNCKHLQLFDVSANGLSGNIPKEMFSSFATLGELFNVSSNNLTGSLSSEIGKMTMVQTLDVSRNQFSGPIPSTIQDCQNLLCLDMSRNSFQGPIPSSLTELKAIEYIDLSSNSLSAKIPSFDSLQYLQYLNLSSNKLQGEIPKRGIFLNVSAVFLSNNTELCGGIDELRLPKCPVGSTGKRKTGKLIAGVVVGGIGLCIAIALGFFLTRRKRPEKIATDVISFEGLDRRLYSYYELRQATGNFNSGNLIGKGSFGSVYKGVLRDGASIAIKVFDLDQRGALKSFLTECEVFRTIRHRNLVKILSACSGLDFKALVLEFMPNGNLETWLHRRGEGRSDSERGLSLKQRIDIALDVAAAMEYLHHGLETPVVHCDLKPSNVLLDEEMTAHVADFGLARLLQDQSDSATHNQSITSGLKGSIGYVAPEYGLGSEISIKGDVYSYGILVLEMLTGRSPVDEMFRGEMNLQRWVEIGLSSSVVEILDEELEAYSFTSLQLNHLTSIINVGLKCASQLPDERPLLKDVLAMIKKIRVVLFSEIVSTRNETRRINVKQI